MHCRCSRRSILAVLLAALVLAPALAQQGPQVTIARIAGTVEVQHAKANKGRWVAAKKDQQIGSGWSLRTGFDGKVQLVFPLDNVVILKSNSVLTVDKLDDGGGASVNQKSGGMLADLQHALSAGSEFEVKTPKAMAVVRGTKFGIQIKDTAGESGVPAVQGNQLPAVQRPILLPERDVNGDGRADVIVNGAAINDLRLAMAGDGSVKPGDGSVRPSGRVSIETTDTNGDGVAELLLTFLGRDTGQAGEVNVGSAGDSEFTLIVVGDVDGDSIPDYRVEGDGRADLITDAYNDFLGRSDVGDVSNAPASTATVPDGNATDVTPGGDRDVPAVQDEELPDVQDEASYNGRPVKPSDFAGPGTVEFYGYRGKVDIFNDQGHTDLTEGTTIGVGDGPPSPAAASGPGADQFMQSAEDTLAFEQAEAEALGTTADLAAVRAELNAIDKRLKQIEVDWKRYVREQAHGQLLLVWRDVLDLRDRATDADIAIWHALDNEQHPEGEYEAMIDWMQQHGVPDVDLPALLEDIFERINALRLDVEPLLEGDQELKDRTQGTIERGNPQLGTRFDAIDTDNDGVGDATELLIGTDPVRSNDLRGFITLIAPDNNDTVAYPGTTALDFEYEPLDTDVRVVYDLILESGGRQIVRRNARPRERFTLAELVGPSGSFANSIDAAGLLAINWHVEAQLSDRARRTNIPQITSETRRLNIQTAPTTTVEVNLSGPSTARVGTPVTITGDITDVTALGDWEITIAYDPAVLRFAIGNKTGLFANSTVFFNDNGNGTLVVSGSAPRGSAGITGAGDIFTLTFDALVPGDVEVAVTRVTLHNTVGGDIPARPGDTADVRVTASARPAGSTASPSAPTPPSSSGGSVPFAPQVGGGDVGLAPIGPIVLIAPKPGATFPYPGTDEIEIRFEEIRTSLDVVYNLILTSGGVRQQRKDVATGDSLAMATLVGKSSPFANQIGADGKLSLQWQIEAEVDSGGPQATRAVSETRSYDIVLPQNSTVTFDLANGGTSSRLKVGDNARIRGSLSQVNALGKFELTVRYDPSVLTFITGRKLGLFSRASVQFDTVGSGLVIIKGTAAGDGLSGDGDCFELEFAAHADGAVTVEPVKATLEDTLGRTIQGVPGDSVDLDISAAPVGRAAPGSPPGHRDPFKP
jgi:hypothetical protein